MRYIFILLAAIAVACSSQSPDSSRNDVFGIEKFNREKWLSGGAIRDPMRCLPGAGMAEDIRARVIKPGMSRFEVTSILGGPDTNASKLEYALGTCVGSNEQSLVIHFD